MGQGNYRKAKKLIVIRLYFDGFTYDEIARKRRGIAKGSGSRQYLEGTKRKADSPSLNKPAELLRRVTGDGGGPPEIRNIPHRSNKLVCHR